MHFDYETMSRGPASTGLPPFKRDIIITSDEQLRSNDLAIRELQADETMACRSAVSYSSKMRLGERNIKYLHEHPAI